jgi:anti-anti-sigma factor
MTVYRAEGNMLELGADQRQGCLVIHVNGRLDTTTAPTFDQSRTAWMGEGHRCFVLDLSSLEYLSSAGLRSIISMAKQAGADGGSVSLAGARGLVKDVITLSGFDVLLSTFDTVDAALGAV